MTRRHRATPQAQREHYHSAHSSTHTQTRTRAQTNKSAHHRGQHSRPTYELHRCVPDLSLAVKKHQPAVPAARLLERRLEPGCQERRTLKTRRMCGLAGAFINSLKEWPCLRNAQSCSGTVHRRWAAKGSETNNNERRWKSTKTSVRWKSTKTSVLSPPANGMSARPSVGRRPGRDAGSRGD